MHSSREQPARGMIDKGGSEPATSAVLEWNYIAEAREDTDTWGKAFKILSWRQKAARAEYDRVEHIVALEGLPAAGQSMALAVKRGNACYQIALSMGGKMDLSHQFVLTRDQLRGLQRSTSEAELWLTALHLEVLFSSTFSAFPRSTSRLLEEYLFHKFRCVPCFTSILSVHDCFPEYHAVFSSAESGFRTTALDALSDRVLLVDIFSKGLIPAVEKLRTDSAKLIIITDSNKDWGEEYLRIPFREKQVLFYPKARFQDEILPRDLLRIGGCTEERLPLLYWRVGSHSKGFKNAHVYHETFAKYFRSFEEVVCSEGAAKKRKDIVWAEKNSISKCKDYFDGLECIVDKAKLAKTLQDAGLGALIPPTLVIAGRSNHLAALHRMAVQNPTCKVWFLKVGNMLQGAGKDTVLLSSPADAMDHVVNNRVYVLQPHVPDVVLHEGRKMDIRLNGVIVYTTVGGAAVARSYLHRDGFIRVCPETFDEQSLSTTVMLTNLAVTKASADFSEDSCLLQFGGSRYSHKYDEMRAICQQVLEAVREQFTTQGDSGFVQLGYDFILAGPTMTPVLLEVNVQLTGTFEYGAVGLAWRKLMDFLPTIAVRPLAQEPPSLDLPLWEARPCEPCEVRREDSWGEWEQIWERSVSAGRRAWNKDEYYKSLIDVVGGKKRKLNGDA